MNPEETDELACYSRAELLRCDPTVAKHAQEGGRREECGPQLVVAATLLLKCAEAG